MSGQARAFESMPEKAKAVEPQEKRSATILPFKAPETAEKESDFAKYQNMGGHLTETEYQRFKNPSPVAKSSRNEIRGNPTYAENAKSYAARAGFTLSNETLAVYLMLVQDEEISSPLLRGDQQKLAEALRITGNRTDLEKFIDRKNFPEGNIEF